MKKHLFFLILLSVSTSFFNVISCQKEFLFERRRDKHSTVVVQVFQSANVSDVSAFKGTTLETHNKIKGQLYISGSIAYAPFEYCDYFKFCHESKNGFFSDESLIKPYEPVIQVSAIILSKDRGGNAVETLITKNNRDYQTDQKCYGVLHLLNGQHDISENIFPEFLPLRLFEQCKHVGSRIQFLWGTQDLSLECIAYPEKGLCFQGDLQKQLEDFITSPCYFEWNYNKNGILECDSPREELIKREIIKEQKLPLILRYCSYQYCMCKEGRDGHGENGLKNVEEIKAKFSYFLYPKMVMRAEELIRLKGQAAFQEIQ